jgi:hypothetical protein
MAIEDAKEIEIRGRKVIVTGEQLAPRRYLFTGRLGHIIRQVNVVVGDAEGNIAGNTPEELQKDINTVRSTVAEQVVNIIEHIEFKELID